MWNLLVSELRKGHVRLKDEADSLAWAQDKALGRYTARLGHKVMISGGDQAEVCWWTKIWRIKTPKKTMILWLALRNRVLNCDMVQKRAKNGPCICYICGEKKKTLNI